MSEIPQVDHLEAQLKSVRRDILAQQLQIANKDLAIDDKHKEIARLERDMAINQKALADLKAKEAELVEALA